MSDFFYDIQRYLDFERHDREAQLHFRAIKVLALTFENMMDLDPINDHERAVYRIWWESAVALLDEVARIFPEDASAQLRADLAAYRQRWATND